MVRRTTHQKMVIQRALNELRGQHPTADDIYLWVKHDTPSISRATVYRILNQFAEERMVTRNSSVSSSDIYDINNEPHYHFQCDRCRKVIDVDIPLQSMLDEIAMNDNISQITGHDTVFHGVCKDCDQK